MDIVMRLYVIAVMMNAMDIVKRHYAIVHHAEI